MKGSLASLALLVTIAVASDYVVNMDGNNSTSTQLTGTTRTGGRSGGRMSRGSMPGSSSTGTGPGRVVVGRTSGH